MERQRNAAPVIIRRKKITSGQDAHHGGAWKVAYADFVTAMMAFFLLMWLLSATTETQRRGLADYFSPTIPLHRTSGGGDGAFGGNDLRAEERLAFDGRGGTHSEDSQTASTGGEKITNMLDGDTDLATVEELLLGMRGETIVSELLLRHVATRLTDEGLIVEIFDLPDAPLFDPRTNAPLPVLRELADLLAEVFAPYVNGIAIEGHSRAYPVVLVENPTWDLSAARAQKMRVLLETGGLAPMRMKRVTGHADRRPATPHPSEVRNSRLEVILLRNTF